MFELIQARSRGLGLALLVGLFAVAVGAVAAGAQRTDSAYPSALIIGIPAGLIGSRLSWLAFTRQVGVLPLLHAPPLTFGILVLARLTIALVVSAIPARSAARTRPAGILRSEYRAWLGSRRAGSNR